MNSSPMPLTTYSAPSGLADADWHVFGEPPTGAPGAVPDAPPAPLLAAGAPAADAGCAFSAALADGPTHAPLSGLSPGHASTPESLVSHRAYASTFDPPAFPAVSLPLPEATTPTLGGDHSGLARDLAPSASFHDHSPSHVPTSMPLSLTDVGASLASISGPLIPPASARAPGQEPGSASPPAPRLPLMDLSSSAYAPPSKDSPFEYASTVPLDFPAASGSMPAFGDAAGALHSQARTASPAMPGGWQWEHHWPSSSAHALRCVSTPATSNMASPVSNDPSATPAMFPLIHHASTTEPGHDLFPIDPINFNGLPAFTTTPTDGFGACPTGLTAAALDDPSRPVDSPPLSVGRDFAAALVPLPDTLLGGANGHKALFHHSGNPHGLDSPFTEAGTSVLEPHESVLGLSMPATEWSGSMPSYAPTVDRLHANDAILGPDLSHPLARVRTEELFPLPRFSVSSRAMDRPHSVTNGLHSPPALRWMHSADDLSGSHGALLHHGRSDDRLSRPRASLPYNKLERPRSADIASRNKTPPERWQDTKSGSSSPSEKEKDSKADSRPWKCSLCGRGFERRSNLRQHADVHDPQRKRPWKCPLPWCGDHFSRKHDAQRHLIKCHVQRHEMTQEEINLITSVYPTISLHPSPN